MPIHILKLVSENADVSEMLGLPAGTCGFFAATKTALISVSVSATLYAGADYRIDLGHGYGIGKEGIAGMA